MEKTQPRREKMILSLDRDYQKGLAYLARETGDPNMTGLVRRHIESEMRERFGPNWRKTLAQIEAPDVAVAS